MTEIIAEIGINFGGDICIAETLIEQAKSAGADVAKFQCYVPEKTLDRSLFDDKMWDHIKKTELTFEDTKRLKEYCDKTGIEFMASAFDLERLQWLEDLGVKRHKIASRSIYDTRYVEAVQATGKEYLVSDGWVDCNNKKTEKLLSEIEKDPKGKILYCVAEYPTLLKNISFSEAEFWFFSNYYSGWSDHTGNIYASTYAMAHGAEIIEIHFTQYKNAYGCDHSSSITYKELKQLCQFRDNFQIIRR